MKLRTDSAKISKKRRNSMKQRFGKGIAAIALICFLVIAGFGMEWVM